MASLNPALWHGLPRTARSLPATRPTCSSSPTSSASSRTSCSSAAAALEDVPRVEVPDWVRQTVRMQPVSPADLAVQSSGGSVRAIGLIEDQVVTESLVREPRSKELRGRRP